MSDNQIRLLFLIITLVVCIIGFFVGKHFVILAQVFFSIKTIFIQQSVVDSLQDLFSPLLPNNTSTSHIIELEGKKIFEV